MFTRKGYSKMWFLVALLVVFVAGCGSSHNNNVAPSSSAKAITAYSIAGVAGTINETAKTISVALPSGTNKTALIATFTSTGALVTVGTTTPIVQTSGTTTNSFTGSVVYKVAAANGTTASYTVTVTAALSSAKAITAYSINGVAGAINTTTKAISVKLPYSTASVTALIANFTRSGTGVVTAGTTTPIVQTSGTTTNDFTGSVVYKVTAADSSTVNYTVTVTVAAIDDKAITAYSLKGVAGTIVEGTDPKTIAVAVPFGTVVSNLTASFLTTGELVTVGTTTQESGITPNDFTGSVDYLVTAASGTTATYTVTVTVASTAVQAPVDLGLAGNYAILAKAGVSTTGTTHVTGDIGVSPAAATYITGFALTADPSNQFSTSTLVTGQVFAANYAVPTPANLTAAVSDMETASTDAAGRAADYTELYAGDISGQILVPGTYKWGTGVLITSAGVTLNGGANDVWIFQIAQNLTVNNSAIVHLTGGAQPQNVFWQVSGQATLGTAANFKGIILCQTLISLNTGAVVNGRLLSQTAVTLNAATVTQPAP